MMIVPLLVATLVDLPTVRVDIDALAIPHAEVERLHGELMTRLVEAGHPVGSQGVVSVRLVGGGDVVHVEAQHGSRVLTRDVKGEGAVLRLAAIHAALDLLTELEQDAEWIDPEVAPLRDRFVLVDADPGAERWLGETLRALTENGRVATSNPQQAQWRVCLRTSDGEKPMVAAAPVSSDCPPGASADDLAGAVLTALASAEQSETHTETEEDPPEPAVVPTPTRAPSKSAAPHPTPASPRFSGALGAGLSAQGRLGHPELAVLVHGDARHARGGLLTLRVELAPSSAEDIRALDTWLTVGGGYAFTPIDKLRIEIAGTVGLALHAYWVGDDRDTSPDFAATLPVTIAGRLSRRTELGAQLVGGWSVRSREHRIATRTIWERDAWRIGGMVVFRILLGRETSRAALR